MEFETWLSPSFKLYFVQEFQKLNEERKASLEWSVHRLLSKVNYHIQANAIRENLVPVIDWNTNREGLKFATEADVLNVAVFGMAAKEWRQTNPKEKGNMRDFATPEQLIILANLESMNAELIREGLSQDERVVKLNETAVYQMRILTSLPNTKSLPEGGWTKKIIQKQPNPDFSRKDQ